MPDDAPKATETTRPTTSTTTPAAKKSTVNLSAAGASGDPAVQKLLAEREGHLLSVQPDPSLAAQRENAEKAIAEIDKQLGELGY